MPSRQGSPPEEKPPTTTTATPPPTRIPSLGDTTTITTTASTTTTTLLLLLVVLALFPTLFHLLWTLPLRLILPSPHPHHQHSPSGDILHHQTGAETMWTQKHFSLPARARGSYLITDTVLKELPEIRSYKVGLLNLFIQHTSCALSLNENWDEVRFLLFFAP